MPPNGFVALVVNGPGFQNRFGGAKDVFVFTPDMFGDPKATSEALFKVMDADEPPLRLVLGSTSLPIIRKIYADRLDTWEKWEAVSNAAQGSRKG